MSIRQFLFKWHVLFLAKCVFFLLWSQLSLHCLSLALSVWDTSMRISSPGLYISLFWGWADGMGLSPLPCGILQTRVWLGSHSALDPPPVAMVKRRELFLTPVPGLLSNISVVLGENLKNWLKTGKCMASMKILQLHTVGLVCFGWPLQQDWHIYVESSYLVFNLEFYTSEW